MRIVRFLALFSLVALLSSCGGDDESTSTTTTTEPPATTAAPAAGDDAEAPSDDETDESSVGTLTIDGEEYDVALGDEVVLSSWADQSPRNPCVLEGGPISVVLVHEGEGGRYLFVAEGPTATDLSLTLLDEGMMTDYEATGATATIGAGTFDYSGTLEGDLGPVPVQVAIAC